MSPADAEQLVRDAGIDDPEGALLGYVSRQRWFASRERAATGLRVVDAGRLPGEPAVLQVLVEVTYEDAEPERYQVPLSVRAAGDDSPGDHAVVTRTTAGALALDALLDPAAALRMWRLVTDGTEVGMAAGRLTGRARAELAVPEPGSVRPLGREQSNSSLLREEAELMKFFRRVEAESSPEIEMLEALDAAGFRHIAAPSGVLEYDDGGRTTVLAVLQPYLHNATDGFQMALTSLRDLYDVAVEEVEPGADARQVVDDQGSDFTPEAERLGHVIAAMHVALASPGMPPALAHEHADHQRVEAWAEQMTGDLDALLAGHPDRLADLPVERLRAIVGAVGQLESGGTAVRLHGDLHLGQLVRTDSGWTVLDFEGEPDRPVGRRRERWSPLRDVAGMLRSFDYAAAVALVDWSTSRDTDWDHLRRFRDAWAEVNREAFWTAYTAETGAGGLLPDAASTAVLLKAFEVQKAIYEVGYELGHRPDLAWIPIEFLERQV
ncbi:MAG: maltokinase [Chloroflexota bacterium]|nr:maltokinase [Chloroflexota bacterium]